VLLGLLVAGGLGYLVQSMRGRRVCARCRVGMRRWHAGLITVVNEAGLAKQLGDILAAAGGSSAEPLWNAIARGDALGPPPVRAWVSVMMVTCPRCHQGELTVERHGRMATASQGLPGKIIGRGALSADLVRDWQRMVSEFEEPEDDEHEEQ
jgi:hypothetical protein